MVLVDCACLSWLLCAQLFSALGAGGVILSEPFSQVVQSGGHVPGEVIWKHPCLQQWGWGPQNLT